MNVSEKQLSDDLRRALQPLRPDAKAFAEGFEEKLAKRGGEGAKDGPAHAMSPWASAAGFLPMGALPSPFVSSATGAAGGAAGKSSSVLGWLASPALALAMVGLAFVVGLRSVLCLAKGAERTKQTADEAIREWWGRHRWPAGIALGGLAALAIWQPLEAVFGVLVLSMLALAGWLSQLARVGATSRIEVGALTSGLLGILGGLSLFPGFLHSDLGRAGLASPWIPFLLLAGCVACDWFVRWQSDQGIVRRVLMIGLPIAIFGWIGFRMHTKMVPLDRARLIDFAQGFDEPLANPVEWIRFSHIAEWLHKEEPSFHAHQVHTIANASRSKRLEEAFSVWADSRASGEFSSTTPALLAAARAQLAPPEFWEKLRSDSGVLLVRDDHGALMESGITEWIVMAFHNDLENGERDRLADRLRMAWPAHPGPRTLESMAFFSRMFDLLERPGSLTHPLRKSTHTALSDHWLGSRGDAPFAAGFLTDPEVRGQSDLFQVAPTLSAIRLMGRFGVPADIDLERVESYLLRAATPSWIEALAPRSFSLLSVQPYRLQAEVALRELINLRAETGLGAAQDPKAQPHSMLGHSTLALAAFALVLLCLVACAMSLRGGAPARPATPSDGNARR